MALTLADNEMNGDEDQIAWHDDNLSGRHN